LPASNAIPAKLLTIFSNFLGKMWLNGSGTPFGHFYAAYKIYAHCVLFLFCLCDLMIPVFFSGIDLEPLHIVHKARMMTRNSGDKHFHVVL
jgi:hypothetical protein